MIARHHHRAPANDPDRILLVMLPGVGFEAEAFASHGLVAATHGRGWPVDIVAANPQLDLYLEGGIASALHREIVEPARAQGYARIWLLGVSLGGMGALLYASEHAAAIEGVVLLAPFLGTQGTIAELAKAGGLRSWSAASSAATQTERRVLTWLQTYLAARPASPALYLGYGHADRFAQGHRMLAACLPEAHVHTAGGGHDWDTWRTLWQSLLDAAAARAPRRFSHDADMSRYSGDRDG
jgi:pimeloyl-ACP methyl ester carboxylesterase